MTVTLHPVASSASQIGASASIARAMRCRSLVNSGSHQCLKLCFSRQAAAFSTTCSANTVPDPVCDTKQSCWMRRLYHGLVSCCDSIASVAPGRHSPATLILLRAVRDAVLDLRSFLVVVPGSNQQKRHGIAIAVVFLEN